MARQNGLSGFSVFAAVCPSRGCGGGEGEGEARWPGAVRAWRQCQHCELHLSLGDFALAHCKNVSLFSFPLFVSEFSLNCQFSCWIWRELIQSLYRAECLYRARLAAARLPGPGARPENSLDSSAVRKGGFLWSWAADTRWCSSTRASARTGRGGSSWGRRGRAAPCCGGWPAAPRRRGRGAAAAPRSWGSPTSRRRMTTRPTWWCSGAGTLVMSITRT